jgi:nicotinamide-nucleotide amidase
MPNAILLMTGSELTRGETQDTNGPHIATGLSELGVRVDEIALVPDHPQLLEDSIRGAISRADLVIISGGLGPTADDHTVEIVGRVFGRPVYRHPEAIEHMRARALARGLTADKIPPNFYKQAEVIEEAEVLLNPVGLAPGMAIETGRGLAFVVPGVPREMRAMFQELVVPAIEKRFRLDPPRIVRAKIMGIGESWAEAKIQELGIDFARVEYGISAKPGELLVKFLSHRAENHSYLDTVRELVAKAFQGEVLFLPEGLTDSTGEQVEVEHSRLVHEGLLGAGKTVATAESCTGGLVAKSLTDHPGSSTYFVGSVVAYQNEVKEKVLGVSRQTLEQHGAVSAEVCEAMARGAREIFAADLGIAVTGIAGPGGETPEKPVGLVYVGLATKDPSGQTTVQVERNIFWGNRENVRRLAMVKALDLVRRAIDWK